MKTPKIPARKRPGHAAPQNSSFAAQSASLSHHLLFGLRALRSVGPAHQQSSHPRRCLLRSMVAGATIVCLNIVAAITPAHAEAHDEAAAAAGAPYPNMPAIEPSGVRIGKHLAVPESAKGPAIDPAKGYRIQELGKGLYMITDNVYQSMFMVYETGVVVVDAPSSYADSIRHAIAEVTDQPVTHVIYSHSHIDHIGASLGWVATRLSLPRRKRKRCSCGQTTPTVPFRRLPSATATRSKWGIKPLSFRTMETRTNPATSSSPHPLKRP